MIQRYNAKTNEEAYKQNIEFTKTLTGSFPQFKSPLKAIRRKCLDCTGGASAEIKDCHITSCALWPYRMGKNPFHTKSNKDKE